MVDWSRQVTAPATSGPTTAQTIRDSRRNVAGDIAQSRLRLASFALNLRTEAKQQADLMAIAAIVGITEVDVPTTADVTDANAKEAV